MHRYYSELPWLFWQVAPWYVLVVVVYYVFLIRALLQMLRAKPNTVLLVFGFASLFPVPPVIVMGVAIMVLWAIHRHSL